MLRRWPSAARTLTWASLSRGTPPGDRGSPQPTGRVEAAPVGQLSRSDVGIVDIAPAPVLARLERLDDRVPGGVGVSASVPERRRVAAADLSAGQAQPQMHPRGAQAQAFRAALGVRGDTGRTRLRCGSSDTDMLAFRLGSADPPSSRRSSGSHISRPASSPARGTRRAPVYLAGGCRAAAAAAASQAEVQR